MARWMQDCVEVMAWWMKECVYFRSKKRYRNLIDPLSSCNVVHAIKFSPFDIDRPAICKTTIMKLQPSPFGARSRNPPLGSW
jgi:hypothetical protein